MLYLIVQFLKGLATRNSWLSYYEDAELVSEEGRSLPYVRACENGVCDNDSGKVRMWIEGSVHGNEPAGEQAILALFGKMDANETWTRSVLEKVEIMALPRFNPDGVEYFQREYATGYDSNRDHATLQRQQSRDIKKILSDYNPHMVLDLHEYKPTRYLGLEKQWIKSKDAFFSGAKNPNIHEDIIDLSEGLITNTVFAALESYGMRTGPYFTDPDPAEKLVLLESYTGSEAAGNAKNSAGLLQSLAYLCEIRGIGLADQHFHRRVASGLIVAETLVQLAVDETELIYDTVEGARRDLEDGVDEIVVFDTPRADDVDMEFIQASDGELVDVPVTFMNNSHPHITLTRPRHEAYIFSGGWADVAERLRVYGVEVEELAEEWSGEVQALTIETVELADKRFQGIVESNVTTSAHMRDVTFPKGAFRVSTKQQRAGYAFVALEPENLTSYVRYNIIFVPEGDEYPVFKIL